MKIFDKAYQCENRNGDLITERMPLACEEYEDKDGFKGFPEKLEEFGRTTCAITPAHIDDDQLMDCHWCKIRYDKGCSVCSALHEGDKEKAKAEIKKMQKKYPPSNFDIALNNCLEECINTIRVFPTDDLKLEQKSQKGKKKN